MKSLNQALIERLDKKYYEPIEVFKMIETGKTDKFLNPAYNKEFKKWTDNIIKDLTGLIKFELKDNYIEHNYILAGTGGVGSNILYMLQNLDFQSTIDGNIKKYKQEFNEFDTWDYDNLPRIPVIPNSIYKKDTFEQLYLGSSGENQDNITEPLFYNACQMTEFNFTYFGAVDIYTRKLYNFMKIPLLVITHFDDELNITLNPKPVTDEDISRETYGKIDLNFMIPASQMAGIFMYMLQTKYNKKFEKIDNLIADYKLKKAIQLEKDIYDENYEYYVNAEIAYYAQDNLETFKDRKKSEEALQRHVRLTHANVYNLLHTIEGRQWIRDNIKHSETIIVDTSEVREIIKLWDNMQDLNFLKITPKDVKKYLKCRNGKEAMELIDSLTKGIR